MRKLGKVSGFPEWLPEERRIEEFVIEKIRTIYVSHGFVSMETPAMELLSTLTSQGVVDKELYAVKRLQASEDEEAEMGLHFDLTVPFARYVAQHFSALTFPFRRYCLQKVWRGDRPQRGRFREFYQFDIDIVTREELPLACDAEVVTVVAKSFQSLNVTPYRIYLNNRKVLQGFYRSLGLSGELAVQAITVVDKLDKIGVEGVRKELTMSLGIEEKSAERILHALTLRAEAHAAEGIFASLHVDDEMFQDGVREILEVLRLIPESVRSSIEIDLSLARGLGYYTGTVFEVRLPEFPQFGSAGGGGRYENLTGEFMKQQLPAVGGSIGLTRLMSLILEQKLLPFQGKCPSRVLVTVYSEEQRTQCNDVADILREQGIPCEVYFKTAKLGKQIDYADNLGIPFVMFIDEQGGVKIKDLGTKEQMDVLDVREWGKTNHG